MPRVLLILLSLFFLSAAVPANEPATQQVTLADNAALKYWTAFHFLPKGPDVEKVLSDWDTIPLDQNARKIADSHNSLQYLSQGAKISACDWGLDYSQGPALLLPELGEARSLARLACLRARIEFADRQPIPAINDTANVLALARHAATDGTMVGFLVRRAIEATATRTLAAHLQQLDKNALDLLSQRIADLPPATDTAYIVVHEKYFGPGWILNQAQEAAALGEPIDWRSIAATDYIDPNGLGSLGTGTPEETVAQLQQMMPYFSAVQKTLQQDLGQNQMHQALGQLYHQYLSLPGAKVILADFTPMFDAQADSQTNIILLQAAIAILRDGPDKAKNFRDPINHNPIEYHAIPNGFELVSTVTNRGKRTTLRIAPTP